VQRHPAGEPDPRTGGRPAQRPQQGQAPYPQAQNPQASHPQAQHPQGQYPQGQQQAKPSYQQAPQAPAGQYAAHPQAASGYAQPGYPDQNAQAGYSGNPVYHYPQASPQYAGGQQYAAPQQQMAPAAAQPPVNRQALSSLDSARNAQPTHDFENFPPTQPPQYTRPPQQAQRPAYAAQADGYANGYQQPGGGASPQYAQQHQAAPSYDSWPAQPPAHDPYGQDVSSYAQDEIGYAANGNQPHFDPLQQADWALPASGYVDPGLDPQAYGRAQHGYDQGHAGALEPTYNQEEGYEAEEPRRASWTMRIAGAVVVAIGLGYGLAQAYKAVLGGPTDTAPPVIASDSSPAKEQPLDPGGRKFSHTDSKVLGRLGQEDHASADSSDGGLSESDTSSNGSRQVKTLVVGRDGSIAPPASGEQSGAYDPEPTVSVPGMTVVDAFGSAAHPPAQRVAASEPERPAPEAAVVNSQPRSGMNVKTTRVVPTSTASISDDDPAPARAAPKKQKVAVASPSSGASAAATGANGYVVVLASVPASGSSRLDALRKFADMQQQYGPVLASKTPDVRETNLPGKGPYHRLLVGPPGSRTQANELCTQLKAYGYKDCWVTAY
jgi:hypothetical protein